MVVQTAIIQLGMGLFFIYIYTYRLFNYEIKMWTNDFKFTLIKNHFSSLNIFFHIYIMHFLDYIIYVYMRIKIIVSNARVLWFF